MAQKIAYQKILFAFAITLSLVALQGCGTRRIESDNETRVQTTGTVEQAPIVTSGVQTTGTKQTPASTTGKVQSLNGTFRLQSTYQAPSGPEPLDATVTLKDNIITAVSAKNVAVNDRSQRFQDMFIQGISGQIVGKNIKDVNVTYVNGSSLTAEAFNKALHDLQK